jgi:cephalosporin hydroxylase
MINITDFTHTKYNGEMLPFERFKLTNWILEIKPTIVFEVGTGNGGGSTYFISKALTELNNDGVIYTCDPLRSIDNNMLSEFKNIKYYNIYSDVMLQNLINDNIKPDFIMFDGPENPEVAFNDIKFLETYIEDGTYFSMHDWDLYRPYDGSQSVKSVKIREYFENSNNWDLIEQLHSNIKNSDFDDKEYDSVGLCLYKFKK